MSVTKIFELYSQITASRQSGGETFPVPSGKRQKPRGFPLMPSGTTMLQKFGLWFCSGWVLSWLISCTPAPPPSSQELEFWTMQLQPQFTEYFTELNEDFETSNPEVKVRWIDVPWNAMESKILTAVSAKTAPDVVNLNPNFAAQLASRNAWSNLAAKILPETQEQYLPKVWQANRIEVCQDNQCTLTTFGIPWYLTTLVTIYNQSLLERADLDQPPSTYQELARVAEKVKTKTGQYAFFVTFVPGDSNEVLESLVQMGVKLVDEHGQAAFNTPEGLEAFRYWVDLYQKGLLPPEVLTQGHRHGIELYQAGEIALLNTGAEFLQAIANNAPTIYEQSLAAPQITGKTGKKNVAVMNLVIPRDTNKLDEAVKYALFVTNSKNQLAFAKAANVLPSNLDAIEQYIQELEAKENVTPLEQARKISAIQLEHAEVLVPAIKDINKLQKIIYENLQAAMLQQKSVEQAVNDAASEWNNN
jgi:putative chitobiose transport system substrate-binding protein